MRTHKCLTRPDRRPFLCATDSEEGSPLKEQKKQKKTMRQRHKNSCLTGEKVAWGGEWGQGAGTAAAAAAGFGV